MNQVQKGKNTDQLFDGGLNETTNLETTYSSITLDGDSSVTLLHNKELKKYRPNWRFLAILISLLLCQTIHTGYMVSATYRLYTFMRVRFDWPHDMLATYDSIFGQASLPGAALGAIITGRLLSKGRRVCLLITTTLAVFGILFQLVENMWSMLIGRVIMGFSMGFFSASSGRVIEEFTPSHLYGIVMTFFFFLQQIVSSTTLIIASSGMPDANDVEGLKTTGYWRIFLGFPLIFVVLAYLIQFFLIRHETPKYLISLGKDQEALESIKATYHKDENPLEILRYMKQNSSAQTDKITYKQALLDPEYRLPTYILMISVSFVSFNGAQIFAFYGQVILKTIFDGGHTGGWITIDKVLNYILYAEPIANFMSMFVVKTVPRKVILIIYALTLGVLNFMLAFFDQWNLNTGVVIVVILMVITQDSLGIPLMGLYAIEVTNNSTLGLIQLFQNGVMLVVGLLIPFMVANLSVPNLFFTFGGITFAHGLFVLIFIRETFNLTDKEKKSLYSPKKLDNQ